ncbi:VHS domain-containing protein [Psidium guajava]|nr:VHS domain-containing protein [Psidium guajava]
MHVASVAWIMIYGLWVTRFWVLTVLIVIRLAQIELGPHVGFGLAESP